MILGREAKIKKTKVILMAIGKLSKLIDPELPEKLTNLSTLNKGGRSNNVTMKPNTVAIIDSINFIEE